MKYQIIIESDEILSDDEVTEMISRWLTKWSHISDNDVITKFKLLYAQSLEGIRKELYAKRDELKDEIPWIEEASDKYEKIDETFESISDLFKL
jgi:hypothetical protein